MVTDCSRLRRSNLNPILVGCSVAGFALAAFAARAQAAISTDQINVGTTHTIVLDAAEQDTSGAEPVFKISLFNATGTVPKAWVTQGDMIFHEPNQTCPVAAPIDRTTPTSPTMAPGCSDLARFINVTLPSGEVQGQLWIAGDTSVSTDLISVPDFPTGTVLDPTLQITETIAAGGIGRLSKQVAGTGTVKFVSLTLNSDTTAIAGVGISDSLVVEVVPALSPLASLGLALVLVTMGALLLRRKAWSPGRTA